MLLNLNLLQLSGPSMLVNLEYYRKSLFRKFHLLTSLCSFYQRMLAVQAIIFFILQRASLFITKCGAYHCNLMLQLFSLLKK